LANSLAAAPQNSRDVKREATANGHTLKTLRNAARILEIEYTAVDEDKGKGNTKLWSLPADHPDRRY
jgi:hypothetical protein